MTLWLEPRGATLLIAAGGGIAAFRTMEATIESEVGEKVINGAALVRELRITFEQVPAGLRDEVRRLSLHGDPAMIAPLAEVVARWARDAGLEVEKGAAAAKPAGEELLERMGTRFLQEGSSPLEFLPPRPSRWAVLMARYNSRRLASAGFGASLVRHELPQPFDLQAGGGVFSRQRKRHGQGL
jgi:hypothetical protein